MGCQKVVRVWHKTSNSWIFEVKQYEETMANKRVSNRWNHVRKRGVTLNEYICVQGEGRGAGAGWEIGHKIRTY